MGKKSKKPADEPRRMTKHQFSRFEREQKLNQIVKIGAAGVLAIIVLVLAFGFYREVLAKSGEPIARVNGKEISVGEYAKVLGYADLNLDFQIMRMQELATNSSTAESADDDFTKQLVQQQLQQLQWGKQLLPGQVLDEMINDELIRQEAARRGITVSSQEIDDDIMKQFSPTPDANASGPDDSSDQTETIGDPITNTKTITEVTEDLKKNLTQLGFLTLEEYRRYIVEPAIYREKLEQAFADEVSTSGEQVRARHILVDTEDEAKEVLRKLNDEKLEFEAVAKELSKDTATKDKGGDLDWFPRGVMTEPFEEVAFAMQPGQLSEPIMSDFGYHIIRVDERADDRPFSEEQLSQLKSSALSKWLIEQTAPEAKKVEKYDTAAHFKWANDYVQNKKNEFYKRIQSAPQPGN